MDSKKYDRQIRLFGIETQEKLCSMKVQIIGDSGYVSSEIIKNLVLLGIGHIVVQEAMLECVKKIIPDPLDKINENLRIEVSNEVSRSDFIFIIGLELKTILPGFYICPKCLMFKMEDFDHPCNKTEIECKVAKEFLLGALVVQEFIKLIQGKEHEKHYKIDF